VINTILGSIASIVERNFLLGFFLPILLFFAALAAAVGVSIGLDSVLALVEALTATRWAWTSAAVVIGLVVAAYVLSALSESMTQFWTGESPLACFMFWGWLRAGVALQRRQYLKLRDRSRSVSPWRDLLSHFEDEVGKVWASRALQPGIFVRKLLDFRISLLHPRMSPKLVKERLKAVVAVFAKYDGNALTEEYGLVKRHLLDWDDQNNFGVQEDVADLDRSFGTFASVKPTRLGNMIRSYNYYAFTRYQMEAEILWPRLQHVIPASYAASVAESKALLDFAISMSTLSALFAGLALIAGPWLAYDPLLWGSCGLVAMFLARFFYGLAVKSASQYGDRLRSSFDLFRLDLLKQLGFARPTKFAEECEMWQKLSQLMVYAKPADLEIEKPSP
jgi:hypothetical protein